MKKTNGMNGISKIKSKRNNPVRNKLCFLLLTVLALLTVSSCGAQDGTPPFPPALPFEGQVTVVRGGIANVYDLTLNEDGSGQLAGDGYLFCFSKESCTVGTSDFVQTIDRAFLPDGGLLSRALCAPADSEFLKSRIEENGRKTTVYTLVDGADNFIYRLDESGFLCRIDCEGENEEIRFLFERR